MAIEFPDPPKNYRWRVVKCERVRAIVADAIVGIAEDCLSLSRIRWPQGAFNPPTNDNPLIGQSGFDEQARAEVEKERDFHPGFLDGN